MIKEKTFFGEYKVLELKRNGMYEYYLEKIKYGNLCYMYGAYKPCFPTQKMIGEYIETAEKRNFWGDAEQ